MILAFIAFISWRANILTCAPILLTCAPNIGSRAPLVALLVALVEPSLWLSSQRLVAARAAARWGIGANCY